jgi:hypothetical protein
MGFLKKNLIILDILKKTENINDIKKYYNQEIKEILSNKRIIEYLDGSKPSD